MPISQNDIDGLMISYAYILGLLFLATWIQKWRRYPAEFTRKVVHVGAGMWIVGAVAHFDHWYMAIIPACTFIIFNYLSYRYRLIKAMDLAGGTPGTVYFIVSVTALLLWFWPQGKVYIAVAATMAMTWGDAFAAVLGRAFGKHVYKVGDHRRSLEGSAAMFTFSFLSILLTLLWMDTGIEGTGALALAFLLATVATFLEAVSLSGLDNITVPIGTGLTLWALATWNVDLPMLLLGLAFSALIGALAYRRRSLSGSGVAGAVIVGTLIFGFGGWVWGLTLIAFFVYGSALSKYKEAQKSAVAEEKFDKGSRRDFGQALANGGFGAVLAVLHFLFPSEPAFFAAFVGTMATVNADTWATEIGVLSRRPPRLITTGRLVPPGTSGGITAVGTFATMMGGLLIGLTVWILVGIQDVILSGAVNLAGYLWLLPAAVAGGLGGSLFDSLLGATVQAMYVNAETGKDTEKKVSRSGAKNRFSRGLPFMDNDMVNFISSGFGAAVAALVASFLM
ncbi:DUF92 domain-containing protein [Heliomicrobium undosum]|nr:DUF92 domain-containing protein [Heliomicrobium undosum]